MVRNSSIPRNSISACPTCRYELPLAATAAASTKLSQVQPDKDSARWVIVDYLQYCLDFQLLKSPSFLLVSLAYTLHMLGTFLVRVI